MKAEASERHDLLSVGAPFPVEVLPGLVRDFVVEGADSLQCDAALIAVHLLPALAAAIGTSRVIQLKDDWTEPCVLWTLLVCTSGMKKSPSFELATSAICRVDRLRARRFTEKEREYERAVAAHALLVRQLERDRRKSASRSALPEAPKRPVLRQVVVENTTIEALAEVHANNPRGVLLRREELSAWFAFDQYRSVQGGEVGQWLALHGGRAIRINRKTGSAKLIVVDPTAVQITGGIQPDILRRVLGDLHVANGLAARFLLAMPPEPLVQWSTTIVSRRARSTIDRVVRRLFTLKSTLDPDGLPVPMRVRLTKEAQAVFIEFYNAHNAERRAQPSDALAAAWSKLEGQAARLALLIHLIGWALKGQPESAVGSVSAEAMRRGIALARWFGEEARRVYAVLAATDAERRLQARVRSIGRAGGSVSVREWQRRRNGITKEQARAELDELVARKLGTWTRVPSGALGGRPTERFVLHARAHQGIDQDGEDTGVR